MQDLIALLKIGAVIYLCWYFMRGATKVSVKKGESELMEYRYMYKAYPFDIRRYFKISASSREEADKLAAERYKKLQAEGQTITEEFYPANE